MKRIIHTISALALIVFIILTLWGISDFSLTKIFVGIVGFGVSLFINVFSDAVGAVSLEFSSSVKLTELTFVPCAAVGHLQ